MEEALRKWLARAEEIYDLAMKSKDYKAAIEATTVVMSTEWTLARIDDGKAKMEEMKANEDLSDNK